MASNRFSSVMSIGKAALDWIQGPTDPNLVKVVSQSELAPIPTQDRDGCLVLFGPKPGPKKEAPPIYEVVVHSEKNYSFR
jgi:hypothetical protein